MSTFLKQNEDFNFRSSSLRSINIAAEEDSTHGQEVANSLATIQRVQALTSHPDALPALLNAGVSSASGVAALPQAKFVDLFKDEIGESSARGIYDHAVKIAHRNESLLAQMHGLVRGTGLAVIDGPRTTMARMASVQEQLAASGKDVNLENLFGSMDFYDDNECSSVFSPANYLVELLQFLKNNTLDPSLDENRKPLFPNTFDPNDKNNALSILLLRRPDLQYIELTCENTNTRIPYIDLANEIMESFIVHQSDASVSWTDSKQYDIDAFNVQGESSEELLSQARYTNYTAYSIILDNGYRIGALPFHQPLTAMRIYLRFLNTSRAELLENFSQPDPDILAAGTFTPSEIAALEELNVERRKRAVSAESLGMIPQEYNIITQESFSPKRYLEIVQRTTMSDEAYRSAVRFKALHAYWGYNSESDMLSANDTEKIGLRYVKRQFLPRSGLTYSEVAELLETGYVNEVYSFGKNSFVIQALRSNYLFLRALVEPTVTDDPERKYRRLIDWLYATYLVPFDPVRPLHFKQRRLLNLDDWTSFIHQWFDRLGKLVILELHEPKQDQDSLGPVRPPAAAFLPITGKVWLWSPESANPGPPSTAGRLIPPTSWISLPGMSPSVNQRGNLDASGRFVDSSNNLLGTVSSNSVLYKPGYQRYFSRSTGDMLLITKSKSAGIVDGNLVQLPEETVIAWVNSDDNMLRLPSTNPNEPGEMVRWLNTPTATQVAPTNIDLHGIEAARIAHLDGSDLDLEEWTRIQQFLRLKQHTGFSINELDKTVLGLSSQSSTTAAFRPVKSPQITPALVMELTVLKRLLLETQVELFQLLALFSNISMAGANSLYERLFLSNNLIGIDSVVVPDGGGNVFVANPKISDHTPVICAALHLNGAQLTAILSHASLVDATLTLVHLTWIYRYSLLSEILQVTVVELIQACQVFDLDLEKPTPTSILDFILGFRKLHGAFSISQLRFIFKDQGLAAEFSLEKSHVLKATATISNGLASIELEYPDFNINNEPSMEDVSKLLALVYQSDLMAKITDILGDTPTQATDFYDTHLVPIFGTSDTSRNVLLGNNTLTSAVDKRKLFLLHFMPHLRQILGEKLVTEAMTALSGIDSTETVRRLLRQVLNFPAPNNSRVSALDRLLNLNSFYFQESSSWTGTIWPPTTDVYTFEGYGEIQPDAILIDGVARPFIRRQTELNNAWLTEPVNLTGGRLYSFDAAKQKVPGIKWSTSRTLLATIPSSSLIPNAAFSFVSSVLTSLQKADICIRGLNLSQEEIDYFQSPTGRLHFKFDFGEPVFTDFQNLFTYSELRSSIASSPLSLVSLFKWATAPSAKGISDLKQIASRVAQASHWRDTDIEKLFGSYPWEKTQAADFSNEKILVRMQSALDVVHKVAVDASRLSSWASLATDFGMTKEVAVQVQSEIRSRYALEDWQQASRPLHNELRVAQRNALIAYLLDHPALQKYGIVDADSLFEFFLIDVQMGACLETSRIKQAISTIQQFIQRCILGLEEQNYPKVANYAIDQERWKWMSKQAVWTANRKVFLYPELYIEPTLRDDKSELYEVLEAELSQKDVTPESARDGLKKYLSGVHQLSDLVVQGIFKYTSSNDIVVHFVARTRSNPFSFFYRTYSLGELAWTPWMVSHLSLSQRSGFSSHVDFECSLARRPSSMTSFSTRKETLDFIVLTSLQAIPIDIPTYDTASYQSLNHQSSRPPSIGNYVIPVVWQKRIFIFFAIFAPRVVPQTSLDTIQFPLPGPPAPAQTVSASKLDTLKSWQINLGWTELHNSTWSPKQVSRKAVYEDATSTSPMPMDTYKFIPFVNEDFIQIVVYDSSPKPIGAFEFRGNEAAPVTQASGTLPALLWRAETSFHFEYLFEVNANARIYSLQDYKGGPEGPGASESTPVVFHEPTGGGAWALMGDPMGWSREQEVRFSHLFVNRLFNEAKGIDSFDHIFQTLSDNFDKNKLPFGKSWSLDNQIFNEVYEPSAIYNWEIGFHAPLQLADALLKGQKFQAALDCCHYVFDPYADSKRPNDVNRVWKWKPFQDADTTSLLQGLFNQLLPGKADSLGATINKWRNNPFAPHVIARDRPQAYMKWTVMKYLEILVAYGDWYFRQGTLENLPQALQLYVLAKHLFGPAPQRLPKAGKRKPQTYFSLLSKWDAFSNALVEMELAFPFSNQLPQPIEVNGRDIASTNIFGFATSRYFSVPENSQMRDLRELIDQRIFNIRHCLDIDGKSISYALWDPPINPAVLVSAIAQGMSLSSALNDLNSPMPNYRFHYILQRANELCGDLKAASSMFLGIKEKRDSEALSVLKLRQELVVENLVLDLRKMQLEEAQKAVNALKVSRNGPLSRYQYYSSLAGKTAGVLSETDSEYKEIGLQIPPPLSSGDLAVTKEERLELDQARKAKMRNDEVGKTETAASFFSALPSLLFNAQFWGVGCTISYGTQNIASAMQGHARGLRVQAETHTFNSSEATRRAGYIRQQQDRIQQANAAGHELL